MFCPVRPRSFDVVPSKGSLPPWDMLTTEASPEAFEPGWEAPALLSPESEAGVLRLADVDDELSFSSSLSFCPCSLSGAPPVLPSGSEEGPF